LEPGNINEPFPDNETRAISNIPNMRDVEMSVSGFLESLTSGSRPKISKTDWSVVRVLTRKLRNVKPDQMTIWRTTIDDITFIDKTQNLVEKTIGLPLDWWPMPVPRPSLPPPFVHIGWFCVSKAN